MPHIPPPLPPPPPAPTEHVVTSHNAVTLRPDAILSFVGAGIAADGAQSAALGPGPRDGFEKVVIYGAALPGCTLRVRPSAPAALSGGSYVEIIDENGGTATLRWRAAANAWEFDPAWSTNARLA
jgi:hypothetical protein